MGDVNFWNHRTNKGRVVYDRPRHPFNYKDVRRILKNLCGDVWGPEFRDLWKTWKFLTECVFENEMWISYLTYEDALGVYNNLYYIFQGLRDNGLIVYGLERDFEGFQGGESGGGGATREIEEGNNASSTEG